MLFIFMYYKHNQTFNANTPPPPPPPPNKFHMQHTHTFPKQHHTNPFLKKHFELGRVEWEQVVLWGGGGGGGGRQGKKGTLGLTLKPLSQPAVSDAMENIFFQTHRSETQWTKPSGWIGILGKDFLRWHFVSTLATIENITFTD